IHNKVMRGMSVNSALMISPLLYARAAEFKRHPYDVAAAKKLLADAGYAGGFEVTMDCPNDRYVNDEGICQAVAQMLSRIDIKVKLNAMPKAKYLQKVKKLQAYIATLTDKLERAEIERILRTTSGCNDLDLEQRHSSF